MSETVQRRERLLEGLDTDAFIAVNLEGSDPVTLRYLTGFTGEGALVVSHDDCVLLTDSRYTEQARGETDGIAIEEGRQWNVNGLAAALQTREIARATFSSARVSVYWLQQFKEISTLELVSQRDPVAALRRTKNAEEVAHLKAAAAIADQALTDLLPEIRVGMLESQIALRLEMLLRSGEAEGIAFDFNVSTGANTALNHYNPFHHPAALAPGDLLLFDFGANVRGYRSDITRTFVVGRPSSRAQEIYDLVLQANQRAIAGIRAGMTGVEADAIARNVIAEAGHGDAFGHGLGHGIGLEIHEAPGLSPLSKDTLEAGMVATVEPGIYYAGFGGVRIEDDVVIAEDGCEVITAFPKEELISVGA